MNNKEQEAIWDAIAETWATYKEQPIRIVQEYLKDQQGTILDLGCGSGRNIIPNKKIIYFGVDFSKEQLKQAKIKATKQEINLKTFHAPATKLPFPDHTFDAALCISMIHCIKGKKERQQALKELFRVMKPETSALISVWYQPARKTKEEYRAFKTKKGTYQRYYYYYDEEEFLQELTHTGFIIHKHFLQDAQETKDSFIKRNINVIIQKPS